MERNYNHHVDSVLKSMDEWYKVTRVTDVKHNYNPW